MNNESMLVAIKCRGGCGKDVTTTRLSLHGIDDLHNKYAGFCGDCLPITNDELLHAMGLAIADKLAS
jgi:hypothetical protein